MGPDTTAPAAAILNDAWMVRHYPRAHQALRRRQALAKMGATVLALLEAGADPESVLYAVAVGLYTPDDPRFS